jgi:hypothetical protein
MPRVISQTALGAQHPAAVTGCPALGYGWPGSQVGQFLEIGRNFEHERKRFNTLLGPEKTNQIVDNRVTRAKKRYWRWFGFTVVG